MQDANKLALIDNAERLHSSARGGKTRPSTSCASAVETRFWCECGRPKWSDATARRHTLQPHCCGAHAHGKWSHPMLRGKGRLATLSRVKFPVAHCKNGGRLQPWKRLGCFRRSSHFGGNWKLTCFINYFLLFNTTLWHCKVILQQQCDSATLITLIDRWRHQFAIVVCLRYLLDFSRLFWLNYCIAVLHTAYGSEQQLHSSFSHFPAFSKFL